MTGYHWVAAGTDALGIYLRRIVLFGLVFFLITALAPVAAKWVLIGRWKPARSPRGGWRYLRFWVVRQLLRANPMVLFTGSPLYLLYLRALGARVGRGAVVFARSVPVCTDLLTIGVGAVGPQGRRPARLPGRVRPDPDRGSRGSGRAPSSARRPSSTSTPPSVTTPSWATRRRCTPASTFQPVAGTTGPPRRRRTPTTGWCGAATAAAYGGRRTRRSSSRCCCSCPVRWC